MNENRLDINSSDVLLLDSFKNGDNYAFNLIVLKYQKKIYWTIRKMVLEHDDADEITQEVFIKLHTALMDFRGESQLSTYIYRIAFNYSLNFLKKNKKISAKRKYLDDEDYRIKSDDPNSDEKMDLDKRTEILKEAINTLPEQQRAVFCMRFYENLNYEEIAKILNKSVGGLKANYFHAFKKIEIIIKDKKSKGLLAL